MKRSIRRDEGFALLLTMILVALLSTIVVVLSRRSLDAALQSLRAKDDLQERWALRSARYACLEVLPERMEALFRAHVESHGDPIRRTRERERSLEGPPRLLQGHLSLGKLHLGIRFEDEQAKVNLNTILHTYGRARTRKVLDTLLPRALGLSLGLRPLEPELRVKLHSTEAFLTIEQVFDTPEVALQSVISEEGPSAFADLTLWGNGRIRYTHASEEGLSAVLDGAVDSDKIRRLLDIRREVPALEVDRLPAALSLGSVEGARVKLTLTDTSRCYTLWLSVAETGYLDLTIADSEAATGNRIRVFRWWL